MFISLSCSLLELRQMCPHPLLILPGLRSPDPLFFAGNKVSMD